MAEPQVGDIVTSVDGKHGVIDAIEEDVVTIRTDDGEQLTISLEDLLSSKPFLTFPCDKDRGGCGSLIHLMEHLAIGQAAVISCDNCGLSWTVVHPSLAVYKTSDYEEIWPYTGQ